MHEKRQLRMRREQINQAGAAGARMNLGALLGPAGARAVACLPRAMLKRILDVHHSRPAAGMSGAFGPGLVSTKISTGEFGDDPTAD
jgi:hypothetical protein